MTAPYKHILAAVDGSAISHNVLQTAFDIADHYHGDITLVTVINNEQLTGFTPPIIDDLTEHAEKLLTDLVEEQQGNYPNVAIESKVIFGSPSKAIGDDLPATYHTDVTIVGRTGQSAIERLLIGSTSAAIVRRSATDVIIVNN